MSSFSNFRLKRTKFDFPIDWQYTSEMFLGFDMVETVNIIDTSFKLCMNPPGDFEIHTNVSEIGNKPDSAVIEYILFNPEDSLNTVKTINHTMLITPEGFVNTKNKVGGYSFNVFPNPSTGILTIKNNSLLKKEFVLQNSIGHVVSRTFIQGQSQIELRSLDNGIYFLSKNERGFVSTKRISIVRNQ